MQSSTYDRGGGDGPERYTIRYEVVGTATAVDITMDRPGQTVSQYSAVSVPWTYQFIADKGDTVYISAQNRGKSGSVTVTISLDNETIEATTNSGAFGIATASRIL